jgi:hypothetical protein
LRLGYYPGLLGEAHCNHSSLCKRDSKESESEGKSCDNRSQDWSEGFGDGTKDHKSRNIDNYEKLKKRKGVLLVEPSAGTSWTNI